LQPAFEFDLSDKQNLEFATTLVFARVEHQPLEYSLDAFHSLRWVVLGWVLVRSIIVIGMGHEENECKGGHCSDASQSQMTRNIC